MTIVVAVVVIVIIIVGGYAAYTLSSQNPPAQPTPTPTPQLSVQEQARDASMAYIKTNHPETATLMTNLNWTGGRQETGVLGSETYMYTSLGWTFIVHYPVVQDPEYTVTADYASNDGRSVNWQGTYKGGTVTETSYTYT